MNRREYFVSPVGDDNGTGERNDPWRTLARASSFSWSAGDRLLLEGGKIHHGSLVLRGLRGIEAHIEVGSYGRGLATIEAGRGCGIVLWDSEGVLVRGLHLRGSGYPANQTHGICLYADQEDRYLLDLELED